MIIQMLLKYSIQTPLSLFVLAGVVALGDPEGHSKSKF